MRDRRGKLRRLTERRDAEHRRRSAVQYDPVVNTLRVEELPPPLLAHLRLPHGKAAETTSMPGNLRYPRQAPRAVGVPWTLTRIEEHPGGGEYAEVSSRPL